MVWLAVFATQISEVLSNDKQKEVRLSTEGQFHVDLYMHKPKSWTTTYILLEVNAEDSRLVLHAYSVFIILLYNETDNLIALI